MRAAAENHLQPILTQVVSLEKTHMKKPLSGPYYDKDHGFIKGILAAFNSELHMNFMNIVVAPFYLEEKIDEHWLQSLSKPQSMLTHSSAHQIFFFF